MKRVAILVVLALLGSTPALAEDGEVAFDQWTESFHHGHKVEWTHEVIRERSSGYVFESRTWLDAGSGKTVQKVIRLETDAQGVIQRLEGSQTSPYGSRRMTGVRSGDGLDCKLTTRKQPEREVRIKGNIQSVEVVTLLVSRGKLEPGERKITKLSGISDSKTITYTFVFTKAGMRRTTASEDVRMDNSGSLRRRTKKSSPAFEEVRAANQQEASDLSRTRPYQATPSSSRDAITLDALTLERPGPGWILEREVKTKERRGRKVTEVSLALVHPYEVVGFAVKFPFSPSSDEAERKRLGATIVNMFAKDEKVNLASPEPMDVSGQPAIRFKATLTKNEETMPGRAWLIAGGYFVMVVCPADIAGELADLVTAAEGAIQVGAAEVTMEKVTRTDLGLTLQLPQGWKRVRDDYVSPNKGMARFGVKRVALRGKTAAESLDEAVQAIMKHKVKVIKRGALTIDGRQGEHAVLDGVFEQDGVSMGFRMMFVVIPEPKGGPGGPAIMITSLFFRNTGIELGLADTLLNSVKWTTSR